MIVHIHVHVHTRISQNIKLTTSRSAEMYILSSQHRSPPSHLIFFESDKCVLFTYIVTSVVLNLIFFSPLHHRMRRKVVGVQPQRQCLQVNFSGVTD